MLTHDHQNFPSDVFTIMEAAGASVTVGKVVYSITHEHSPVLP